MNECRSHKQACTEQPFAYNIIQLVTDTEQYARTQLATGKKRRKLIQLVTVLIKSADRLQQPYVRTQLAIATASIMNLNNNKSRSRSKPSSSAKYCAKESIKRLTSKYESKRIINKNESNQEIQVIQSLLISLSLIHI